MKGFNGDENIKNELSKLIKLFNISTIVETGTYMADTTKLFSRMAPYVFTIENNENYYNKSAKELNSLNNVKAIKGNSPAVLKEIFLNPDFKLPALFYLDAHWYNYNPLLDELKEISKAGIIQCVIAIHDFKVPGKDFGYDCFPDGTPYTIDSIKNLLGGIYGTDNYSYYYNNTAEGSYRGIIYIHPKI